jgi:hypothetical protein
MNYMINVDIESENVNGGGGKDCRSSLHESFGPHFDMTVHAVGCRTRGVRAVDRPPSRYWDDKDGTGYTLEEVVERIRVLQSQHRAAYARRCRMCDVVSHLPDWD